MKISSSDSPETTGVRTVRLARNESPRSRPRRTVPKRRAYSANSIGRASSSAAPLPLFPAMSSLFPTVHREADRAASQRILGKETLRHLEIHGKEERPAPGTAAVHQLPDTPGIEETRHTQSLRKLASMAPPQGVMTDSGWNCTPCTSYTRWESAITVPSPSRAVTSRQSGIPSPSTIHE